MSYARRAQERSINNNQSNEQLLGTQLRNEDLRRIRETNLHEKKDKTKKEHRRRIGEMTKHVEKPCPTHASECATSVSNEDLIAEDFGWHGHRKDFDYGKLNSNAIEALMAKKKVKKFKVPVAVAARIRALEASPEKRQVL